MRGFEIVMLQLGESMGPDMIIANIAGPVTLEFLRTACYRVQQLHPMLRAAIRWNNGRPWFHAQRPDPEAVDVRIMRETDRVRPGSGERSAWRDSHNAYWEWVAEEQSKHRFDLDAGFFLRAVWLPDSSGDEGHLIVCSHHAVVDGISLMRLLNQILEQMEALRRELDHGGGSVSDAASRLPPMASLPITPPVLAHLRFGVLHHLLAWIGRRQFARDFHEFIDAPWLPVAAKTADCTRPLEVSTQCVFAAGATTSWESLYRECKRQQATVGGAYGAAIQFALVRHLRERGLPVPTKNGNIAMPFTMDFNMRERVERGSVHPESIGLFTSIAGAGVEVANDVSFWELARAISARARSKAEGPIPKLFQCVLDKIFDYAGVLRAHGIDLRSTAGTGEGVNVSNVGRYPFDTSVGEFSVKRIFGYAGACVSGPMFMFWLRHINGRLCYNAAASSPAVERSTLQAVFADVVDLMENRATAATPLTLAGHGEEERPSDRVRRQDQAGNGGHTVEPRVETEVS